MYIFIAHVFHPSTISNTERFPLYSPKSKICPVTATVLAEVLSNNRNHADN